MRGGEERRSVSRGEIFRRMLQHPRYLFPPWIPVVKTMEGEVFARQTLAPPVLDVACGDGIFSAEEWRQTLKLESLEVVQASYLLSQGVMTLWSALTSSPFKLIFLPFQLARERDWPRVRRLLGRLLLSTVLPVLERAAGEDPTTGGYLFLIAEKAGA